MTRRHHSLFPSFPQEDQRRHRAGVVAAIERVVDSGSYILGGEAAGFEAEFGEFLGVEHVVGVGNGTDEIDLVRHLEGEGIPVCVHYPMPLHPHLDEEAVSLVCDVIESLDLEAGHAAS